MTCSAREAAGTYPAEEADVVATAQCSLIFPLVTRNR